MLILDQLTVGYCSRGRRTVVATDISLGLKAGELVCLVGPNGAGKSTLMRTVAAIQQPLDGRILLRGHDIHKLDSLARARMLGVVLTERATAGLLTARDMVALGRYPFTGWSGKLSRHDHEQVDIVLDQVGASLLANRFVAELSDGERQRVMLARALAQEPALLVLDEITAFLDISGRISTMHLLRRIARQTGCTILVSTHDFELAIQIADLFWLVKGDLNVHAGCPEDLALCGVFDDLFKTDNLMFDRMKGNFRIPSVLHRKIKLLGTEFCSELSVMWTMRLLERLGYSAWQPADGVVEITLRLPSNNDPQWRLQSGDISQSTESLTGLAAILGKPYS